MPEEVVFESMGEEERTLLLQAYGFDVDEEGYILNENGRRVKSEESPSKYLKIGEAALVQGSLKVMDSSPTSISRFLRETEECSNE